jgi:dCMP deaminase
MERPTWNEYFKEMVQVCAKRSTCKRLHVGCLLVRENRIIAQGYNGYLPGCPHEQKIRDGREIATIHAEQNAVTDCAKRGVSSKDCIAYITHYPCINCMKILCAAGIKEIFYLEDYHNDNDMVEYFSKIAKVSIKKL